MSSGDSSESPSDELLPAPGGKESTSESFEGIDVISSSSQESDLTKALLQAVPG
jgi:hypothetical protein